MSLKGRLGSPCQPTSASRFPSTTAAPAEAGSYGQIIDHCHEIGPKSLLAASWLAWLSQLADDLEAGRYVYVEAEETVAPPSMTSWRYRGSDAANPHALLHVDCTLGLRRRRRPGGAADPITDRSVSLYVVPGQRLQRSNGRRRPQSRWR